MILFPAPFRSCLRIVAAIALDREHCENCWDGGDEVAQPDHR
jgi:hypothetical protein